MKNRIAHIDGLRALAVLLVVLDHITWHAAARTDTWFWRLGLDGAHGVDLFFVLSGYCLSYPFLARAGKSAQPDFRFSDYLAKRIVRIIPPYYCALLFFGTERIAQGYAGPSDLFMQALFLQRDTSAVNEAFWTLAVEFRWYFLFPIALWLWFANRRLFFFVIAACIVCFDGGFVRWIDVGALPAFMLGIVAAQLALQNKLQVRWWVALPVIVGLAIASIVLERTFAPWQAQAQVTWQLTAFATVALIGACDALKKLFSLRSLVAIGVASYSIYLTHVAAVGAVEITAARFGFLLPAVLALAAALALGFAFWRVFEQPFMSDPLRSRATGAVERLLSPVIAGRSSSVEP